MNRVGAVGIAWGAYSQKAASIAAGVQRLGVPVIVGPHGWKYRRLYKGDPDNDEAEVYRGISRRFHPSWGGWQIIDALRLSASNDNEFYKTLEQNQKLKEKVRVFFKQMYWDRFWGDRVPDQKIAEELFETSTEMGVTATAW